MVVECQHCGIKIKYKENLYRHVKKYCKKANLISILDSRGSGSGSGNEPLIEREAEVGSGHDNIILEVGKDNLIYELVKIKEEIKQQNEQNEQQVEELRKQNKELLQKITELQNNTGHNINITQNNIVYFNNVDAFELMENKLSTQGAVDYYLAELPLTKDPSIVITEIIEQLGNSCPISLDKNNDLQLYVNKDRKEPLIDKYGNFLIKQTVRLCLHASHKAYGISARNAPDIDLYPEDYNKFMIDGKGKHPSLEKWNKDKDLINDMSKKLPTNLLKSIKLKIKDSH